MTGTAAGGVSQPRRLNGLFLGQGLTRGSRSPRILGGERWTNYPLPSFPGNWCHFSSCLRLKTFPKEIDIWVINFCRKRFHIFLALFGEMSVFFCHNINFDNVGSNVCGTAAWCEKSVSRRSELLLGKFWLPPPSFVCDASINPPIIISFGRLNWAKSKGCVQFSSAHHHLLSEQKGGRNINCGPDNNAKKCRPRKQAKKALPKFQFWFVMSFWVFQALSCIALASFESHKA